MSSLSKRIIVSSNASVYFSLNCPCADCIKLSEMASKFSFKIALDAASLIGLIIPAI